MTIYSNPMNNNFSFGFASISKDTPKFAKNLFYLYFILSKAIIGWLGYTKLFDAHMLYELIGIITLLLDPVMLGVSEMFGCEPAKEETTNG